MLSELNIENFILIDELNLQFHEGMNVLSGETGAGKSILIDALGFVVGQKAEKDSVRKGAEKSVVQAVFHVSESVCQGLQAEFGINADDGQLILQRELFLTGRSTARINGLVVTQNVLDAVGEQLIDFHGQHQHQSLLNPRMHLSLLDAFFSMESAPLREAVSKAVLEIQALDRSVNEFGNDSAVLYRKQEALKFEINEISEARLESGEDLILEEQMTLLQNTETVLNALNTAATLLDGEEESFSAIRGISEAYRKIGSLKSFASQFEAQEEALGGILESLRDFTRDLERVVERTTFDEEAHFRVQERLNVINRLKRKYGNSVEAILDYLTDTLKQQEQIEHHIDQLERYAVERQAAVESYRRVAEHLSQMRREKAHELQELLIQQLHALNLTKARIEITIRERSDPWGVGIHKDGSDTVEFQISMNAGEDLKPLRNVASGGELSRIMLAFKIILAHADQIGTLVFDEIDAGISGKTATIVSEKLIEASSYHQILCISHLPQICSAGDLHFRIEKSMDGNETRTRVVSISGDDRIREIGRMIGGSEITDNTLKAAEELISFGQRSRQNRECC